MASSWLAPFDGDHRLDQLDERLQADADLVWRLALSGYTGSDWQHVAETLVGYGWRVLTAWILDGTIRAKCQAKGWPGPWDSRCRSKEAARDLAADTVTVAIRQFRDTVLVPGRWSPNKGASLRTYFIGQCLLRWPNAYRAWRAIHDRQLPLAPQQLPPAQPEVPDDTALVLVARHGHGTTLR